DLRAENRDEFLKYYCAFEAASIVERLAFDAKACLLVGPKGVGKTSAIYFVKYSLPESEFSTIMFKEPPESLDDLAKEAGLRRREGIIDALVSALGGSRKKQRGFTRAEIADHFRKLSRDRKTILFLDEAHLAKAPEMYMEFKYLLDEVPNLRAVICALGKEGFPDSFLQLVGEGNVFQRNNFTAAEMRKIIEHRVAAVGERNTAPFPEAFLKELLKDERVLLSPRYVFDELNGFLAALALGKSKWKGAAEYANDLLIQSAIEDAIANSRLKGKPREGKEGGKEKEGCGIEVAGEQGSEFLEMGREAEARDKKASATATSATLAQLTTSNAEWWVSLSPSQKQILELLIRNPNGLTLSEIRSATGLAENTAFNSLYQLRGDDNAEKRRKPNIPWPLIGVEGKPVGGRKKNVYRVDEKIKNLFTLH
ncbi:MAG: AAA family ATPase, partial [Candidatus Micrarchaeota archaeon]